MEALTGAFAALAAREQFVTWYAVPKSDGSGKYDKIPCHWQTGAPCDAHDPRNWTSATNALVGATLADKSYGAGAGFVFTAADPFFFLDIDGALRAGQWSPLAQELVARFAGCAVEVSHSGTGLHVFGSAPNPPPHGTRYKLGGLELYTSGRFVALTGYHASGDAGHDASQALAATVAQLFPPSTVTLAGRPDWTDGPVPEWAGPVDDDELIRRALRGAARSIAGQFGGALTFAHLWRGDVPEDQRSESDQQLANHLAFWTGKDCARMERLMRSSGLLREKWDSPAHRDYLSRTILNACAYVSKVAADTPRQERVPSAVAPGHAPAAATEGPGVRDVSREFMGAADQRDYFTGCTFIADHLRIYCAPRNKLMVREAFDVEYGGHIFTLDAQGEKTTDSAYLALTRSRVNRPAVVDDLCFRPELAAGVIVREGLRSMVNTYVPYVCERAPGDPTPFLAHLAKMLPVEGDRLSLMDYLAHLTQRPGVKIQWWPVLQGVQGNGKTLLTRLMAYINGEEYSHLPNAAALAKDGMKFNGWVLRKTFVAIEEVSLGSRRDFLEELKPIVTNERIPIEKKGVDQITGDNRANGIICTNHKDGVPIDDNERRYGIYFTAQQSKADLVRDGMDGDYFPDLYDWFFGREAYAGQAPGLAIVADYLAGYPIPAALPARAPETSSTRAAVFFSLGRAEQEILEAIEQGLPGFCGGWVSSKYLDALLDGIRAPVPRNKRRDMMQRLGYDWHPALRDGRVDNLVLPDNARSKLYLRTGHLALQLDTPAKIAEAYTRAQTHDAASKAFANR